MKKQYITPTIETVNIELANMLAASVKVSVYTDEEVSASESLSNDRRGRWGDLWE